MEHGHPGNIPVNLWRSEISGILAMIFYVVVVTIIAVVVTIWIGWVAEKHTGKKR